MQKFGLDSELEKSRKYDEFRDLELELIQEQSSSLGRAGRRLKRSIEEYKKENQRGYRSKTEKEHLQAIGNDLHSLMLQRELTGFIDSNMEWIKKFYEIPHGALQYVGVYLPIK